MSIKIFYSWQGDTPTKEGRNLIERALERAVASIASDSTVEEAVRDTSVDKDTKGVAGSPPIVETIFRKIDGAAVFVPDLTFIGKRRDGRPTPNPNVLIEYGWALKSLGYGRIVPVMNTAFGEPVADAMPFNMRHLRNPILYRCAADTTDNARKEARDNLSKALETQIRIVLASDEFKASLPTPTLPPKFTRRQPQNGPGRFRSKGEALGISESLMGNSHEVRLLEHPSVWFRVMPEVDPKHKWSVSEIKKLATQGTFLQPLNHNWHGLDYLRAADGFGTYAPISKSKEETYSVAFVFTSGEIWSLDSYVLDAMVWHGRKAIPLLESDFRNSLREYADLLIRLGATPPFRWVAGMEDLKGRGAALSPRPGYMQVIPGPAGNCVEDVIEEEGLFSPGDDPAISLKPFFERIFDACGLDYPEWWHS